MPTPLAFKVRSLQGEPVDLARHAGKVVLFVNVASKCGYTPQYAGLQALHERFAAKGLVVIGVPSNDFGAQEPGTADEIATFCRANYGVTFDMLEKVAVTGPDKAPLFAWLTSEEASDDFAGEVKWNFEKFLVGRDGKLIGRFRSKVAPDDPQLVTMIEQALGD